MSIQESHTVSPQVSVIIPTYNRRNRIQKAIRSVLAQTCSDSEIIVVDDGSTDDTAVDVARLAENDQRIRLLQHGRNKGAPAARNTGIGASRGEFVSFLDSDDEWLPDKLAKQTELFRDGPPALGVVHCGCTKVFADGRPPEDLSFDLRGDVYASLLARYGVQTSTLLVRRDCFDVAGGFREGLRGCQEWDLCIRLARHYLFDYAPEPLVAYHIHGGPTISGDRSRNLRAYLRVVRLHEKEIVDRCGQDALRWHHEWPRQEFLAIGYRNRDLRQLRAAARAFLAASLIPPVHWDHLFDAALILLGTRIYWRGYHMRQSLEKRSRSQRMARNVDS
jgi:glycosyltransferase involved in cell wall biosynthesis